MENGCKIKSLFCLFWNSTARQQIYYIFSPIEIILNTSFSQGTLQQLIVAEII